MLRYLSTHLDNGPVYGADAPLTLTCYTDTDYAADTDRRRSITGLDKPCIWMSARQATATRSPTESEYTGTNTWPKFIPWAFSLCAALRMALNDKFCQANAISAY